MELKVNGTMHHIKSAPSTPLLWVLRDELKLMGTKYGCGIGECGCCTVLVDGEPVNSCVTPVGDVSGAVLTIEGLGTPDAPHPVQQAWLQHNVVQCGYCQPGQLLAAAALLRRNPDPDRAAVDAALQGHLCRCGTYPRIRVAIATAAKLQRQQGASDSAPADTAAGSAPGRAPLTGEEVR